MTIVRRTNSRKNNQELYLDSEQLESSEIETYIEDQLVRNLENMQTARTPTTRAQSLLDSDLDSVDLTTENLPAVDTPDACDKAALR